MPVNVLRSTLLNVGYLMIQTMQSAMKRITARFKYVYVLDELLTVTIETQEQRYTEIIIQICIQIFGQKAGSLAVSILLLCDSNVP